MIVDQLGLQSFRAATIDMARMATIKAFSVGEKEQPPKASTAADGPLDSAFPGAAASLAELAEVAGEVEGHTAVTRLSPRRCLFVWRKDMGHAMVAEARYLAAPTLVGEIDKALIRLLCQIGLGNSEPAAPAAAVKTKPKPGPVPKPGTKPGPKPATPDRAQAEVPAARSTRHHAQQSTPNHRLMAWTGRLLMALGAVAAVWLLLVGLPAVHSQAEVLNADNQRLHRWAEAAMAYSLADATADGEAGPLESALAELARRGFIEVAAVSNLKDRIVATYGTASGLAMGALAVAPAGARGVDINQGSRRVGRLWLMGAEPEAAAPVTTRLVGAAWLAVLAFAVGSILLACQRWLRRNKL